LALWAKPPNSILSVEVAGITGKFYVHTVGELRLLESLIYKERCSLEQTILILQPGDVVYDIGASVGLKQAQQFSMERMVQKYLEVYQKGYEAKLL